MFVKIGMGKRKDESKSKKSKSKNNTNRNMVHVGNLKQKKKIITVVLNAPKTVSNNDILAS